MKKAIAFLASVAVLGTSVAAVPVSAQSGGGNSVAQAARADRADRAAKESILKWHEVMLDTHVADAGQNGGPLRSTRGFAMTMIAVFDAVNAIEQKYRGYNNIAPAARNAQMQVAIAYAAHDVLASVWSDQAGILGDVLADELASINARPAALNRGRTVGKAAAAAILAARVGDGSQVGELPYAGGGTTATGSTTFFGQSVNSGQSFPLQWLPDPETNSTQALGASWGAVKPFALIAGNQVRARPFPAIGSAKYRQEYNDVKAIGAAPTIGGSTSTARTRFIGNYWGYEGTPMLGAPPRIYAQIAIELADVANIDKPIELAKFLALSHISMADTGIAVWDSKYFYNIGRPVTAIRVEDGDPLTQTQAGWTPVGISRANQTGKIRNTPNFPAYPSGHAGFGAAVFETARAFMPNNTAFTFVSEEYNGTTADPFLNGGPRPLVPVRYRSLTQAEVENGRSRVLNGVHWQIDSDVGIRMARRIARYARSTLLTRR